LDGAAGDWFGGSVSIDGDYALIGAFGDDDDGADSGSAYVFKRSGTTWAEEAKLTALDGASSDWFGFSVSIDGEYAIIGAYLDDDNGSQSGSAYVFMYESTPPCADFTYSPIHPTTSDIVQFTDNSTDADGYIASWSWDFGNGNVSSIPNPTHQYSSNEIYEVSLEVTDDDGLTDDISKLVLVGIIPTDICSLTSGWNLKSPPGYDGVNKTDLIILYDDCYYSWSQAVDNTIVSNYIFGWSGNSYILADVLYPTEGYWIYAYQPCTLKRVI